MLSGKPPFNGKDDDEILSKVQNGKLSFHYPVFQSCSPEVKDLLKKMIEWNP